MNARFKKEATFLGAVAMWALLLVSNASAVTTVVGCGADNICTLAELIASSGTITVDDKIFSNFTGSINGSGTFTPTATSQITVTGTTIGGNEALVFTGGFFAGANSSADVAITYTVTATAGLISDIHLSANLQAEGTGFASVDEEARNTLTNVLQCEASISTTTTSDDSCILLTPVATSRITKDVFLIGGTDGLARMSIIDQIITQVPGKIPEPASMLLFGLGLAGLGFWGRKRLGK
jgi:hypothetical protein